MTLTWLIFCIGVSWIFGTFLNAWSEKRAMERHWREVDRKHREQRELEQLERDHQSALAEYRRERRK